MKAEIHPKYFDKAEIRCSCGSAILIGSTKEKLKTELCSKCHPFYTGQQKLVDTAGRVDKFQAKRMKAQALRQETARKAEEKKKKPQGYVEKEIPQEVIERAQAQAGKSAKNAASNRPSRSAAKPELRLAGATKWGTPLGKSGAEEIIKEEKAAAEKAQMPKSEKQQAPEKKQAKQKSKAPAAKKAASKKTASPKKTPVKKAK